MNNEPHDHEKCLKLFRKLSEYIDRELDDASCREVEHHICQCEPCQACLETLKKTIELCKNMDDQPVPAAFSSKLRGLIRSVT
ncbi:MAG: anti-sigma factor [Desulfobacteraceae bacterium]|nr:anti-sigma factor [Desulfobacteraceae bacterium]